LPAALSGLAAAESAHRNSLALAGWKIRPSSSPDSTDARMNTHADEGLQVSRQPACFSERTGKQGLGTSVLRQAFTDEVFFRSPRMRTELATTALAPSVDA